MKKTVKRTKESQDAIKVSEERFRQTFMQAAVGLSRVSVDGKFLSVNHKLCTIVGYPKQELLNLTFQKITLPEDLEKDLQLLNKTLEGEINTYSMEKRYIRKDKSITWVNLTVSLVRDKEKNPKYFISVIEDINDRKKTEEALKESEKSKDEFIGVVAHELKTPVTSIKAYGQVLQTMFRRQGDVKAVEALQKLDAQVNKLTGLIGDLLDVTKTQTGRIEFHENFFDFNELVNEIVDQMQMTTNRHILQKKLAKSKSIYGDRDRIGQVLTNLISNAIKYSPHTNRIDITTSLDKQYVTVSVRDYGVGIPKEKQQRVFEQFFRVSGPKHTTVPGLGLGLYISSEIIKRQEGKIWVTSSEGEGSAFCFRLPLKRQRITKK